MPQIYRPSTPPPVQLSTQGSAGVKLAQAASGLHDLGGALANIGFDMERRQQERQYFTLVQDTKDRVSQFMRDLDDDPDYPSHGQKFQNFMQELTKEHTDPAKVKRPVADAWTRWSRESFRELNDQIVGRAEKVQRDRLRADYANDAQAAIADGDLEGVLSALDMMRSGNLISPADHSQLSEAWTHMAHVNSTFKQVDAMIQNDIESGSDPDSAILAGIELYDDESAIIDHSPEERRAQKNLIHDRWSNKLAGARDALDRQVNELLGNVYKGRFQVENSGAPVLEVFPEEDTQAAVEFLAKAGKAGEAKSLLEWRAGLINQSASKEFVDNMTNALSMYTPEGMRKNPLDVQAEATAVLNSMAESGRFKNVSEAEWKYYRNKIEDVQFDLRNTYEFAFLNGLAKQGLLNWDDLHMERGVIPRFENLTKPDISIIMNSMLEAQNRLDTRSDPQSKTDVLNYMLSSNSDEKVRNYVMAKVNLGLLTATDGEHYLEMIPNRVQLQDPNAANVLKALDDELSIRIQEAERAAARVSIDNHEELVEAQKVVADLNRQRNAILTKTRESIMNNVDITSPEYMRSITQPIVDSKLKELLDRWQRENDQFMRSLTMTPPGAGPIQAFFGSEESRAAKREEKLERIQIREKQQAEKALEAYTQKVKERMTAGDFYGRYDQLVDTIPQELVDKVFGFEVTPDVYNDQFFRQFGVFPEPDISDQGALMYFHPAYGNIMMTQTGENLTWSMVDENGGMGAEVLSVPLKSGVPNIFEALQQFAEEK